MSFPRYPAYKDSGVEWLGEVPEHWNRTALKFLGDYQNGYPFKPEDRGDVGLPIIRISQLTGDDEPAYFSGELDEKVRVRDGDLLFSWSATIDSFIWNRGQAWLNQHIFRVSPSAEADKLYLYYAIKHVAPKLADFDAHGSTMRHIKKESLGERVFVPPVQEQDLIATFLDRETAKIDALIAEQQRLIELLQEKRHAVISHAVTKGLNPDAPMKDSGVEWLGEVPEHWETGLLRRFCNSVITGRTPEDEDFVEDSRDGIPWFTPGCFSAGVIPAAPDKWVSLESCIQRRSSLFPPESVLVVGIGATLGKIALPERTCSGNQQINAVVPTKRIVPCFLALQLCTSQEQMRTISNASTIGIMNQQKTKDIYVCAPPVFEQEDIARFLVDTIDKLSQLASRVQLAINLLQERRSALISAAVTGQIDVRGLVPLEAAA